MSRGGYGDGDVRHRRVMDGRVGARGLNGGWWAREVYVQVVVLHAVDVGETQG